MPFREEPLDKQIRDLRDEVESLKGSASPPWSVHWTVNLSEWRWTVAVVAMVALLCLSVSPSGDHPSTHVEVERGSLTVFPPTMAYTSPLRFECHQLNGNFVENYSARNRLPDFSFLDGGLRPAGVGDYGCGWNSLDADDCGYADGFGFPDDCEFDDDCAKGFECMAGTCAEPPPEVKHVESSCNFLCILQDDMLLCEEGCQASHFW